MFYKNVLFYLNLSYFNEICVPKRYKKYLPMMMFKPKVSIDSPRIVSALRVTHPVWQYSISCRNTSASNSSTGMLRGHFRVPTASLSPLPIAPPRLLRRPMNGILLRRDSWGWLLCRFFFGVVLPWLPREAEYKTLWNTLKKKEKYWYNIDWHWVWYKKIEKYCTSRRRVQYFSSECNIFLYHRK